MKKFTYILILTLLLTKSVYSQNSEWLIYNTSNSEIAFNFITSIAIDSSDNKWIGYKYSKVHQFDNKNWYYWIIQETGNQINDIQVDEKGIVWVGHEYGLSKYDGIDWIHYTYQNSQMPSGFVGSIAFDKKGNKWLGTYSCDLMIFDGQDWTIKTVGESIGYSQGEIFSILLHKNGNIYVGTGSDIWGESVGIFGKCDKDTCIGYWYPKSGMAYAFKIHKIVSDRAGDLWIASSQLNSDPGEFAGLVKFRDIPGDTSWTIYHSSRSGIPSSNVYSIAIDDDDIKWIGTQKGLAKFDGENWTVWDTANSDLPHNSVNCIVIDKHGNKWMGTNNGLAVFREGGVILGAEDQSPSGELTINTYPNPAGDKINISIKNAVYSNISLKIYDIFGREIETIYQSSGYDQSGDFNRRSNNITYDSAKLSAGTYLMFLVAGNERKAVKVEIIK